MSRQRGFTLIELVLTMLLISIFAVGVFPKLFGRYRGNDRVIYWREVKN